jgi:hypothetical protein
MVITKYSQEDLHAADAEQQAALRSRAISNSRT